MQGTSKWLILLFLLLFIKQLANAQTELEKAFLHCQQPQYDSVLFYLEPVLSELLQQQDENAWYANVQQVGKSLRPAGSDHAVNHLKRFTRIATQTPLSAQTRGKLLAITGNELKRQGLFHESLVYFDRSLATFEEANIHDLFVGTVYQYAGNVYTRKGHYDKAITYLGQSLEIFTVSENEEKVSRTLSDLGLVYVDLTDYATAHHFFARGLQLTKISDKQRGNLLLNTADLYQQTGQNEQAFTTNEAAKKAYEKANYQAGLGTAYKLEATLLADAGRDNAALIAYQKALDYTTQIRGQHHREVGKIHLAMQAIHLQQEDYQQSITTSRWALKSLLPDWTETAPFSWPDSSLLYPEPWLIHALRACSKSLYQAHPESVDTLKIALEGYFLAFEVASILRSHYSADEDRSALLDKHYTAFAEAIEIAIHLSKLLPNEQASYLETAFSIAEQSKAYNLYHAISQSQIRFANATTDSLLERKRRSEQELRSAKQLFQRVVQEKNQVEPASLQTHLLSIQRTNEQLDDLLANQLPSYRYAKAPSKKYGLASIREALSPESMLLEYFAGPKHRYLFALTKDTLLVHTIPNSPSLTRAIQQLRETIQQPPGRMSFSVSFEQFTAASSQVYQSLLDPVLTDSTLPAQHLIIIPDAELAHLPLGIGITRPPDKSQTNFRELSYLLRSHTISYHYSADLLALLNQRKTTANKNGGSLLFMAPTISKNQEVVSNAPYSFDTKNLTSTLPGALVELQALSQLYQGTFVLGETADKTRFKELAPQFDLLHLSTHATANSLDPMQSNLHFSENTKGQNEKLYAYELYGMLLRCKLVVLNACETGVGKKDLGEGSLSLGRAFLYAGCESVVMNLWPVDDGSSATIMAEFYAGLAKGQSIPEALRAAKLKALDASDDLTAHPYYWAGGLAVGDASIPSTPQPFSYLWGLVLLPLFLLFLWWIKKSGR